MQVNCKNQGIGLAVPILLEGTVANQSKLFPTEIYSKVCSVVICHRKIYDKNYSIISNYNIISKF